MTYDNGLFEPTFVMTFQVEFCLSIIKNDIINLSLSNSQKNSSGDGFSSGWR